MRRAALMAMAMLAIVAGCNRGNDKMDQPLNNDLNLAAQQRPGQDTMSAAERNLAGPNGAATSTANHSSTSTTTHRHYSSGGSYSSGGTSAGTRSSGTVTVKHTQRDAVIGAAAGAAIGAATSRDKVKGGLIGAAAGGILGGIIGNNVDVQKKKQP